MNRNASIPDFFFSTATATATFLHTTLSDQTTPLPNQNRNFVPVPIAWDDTSTPIPVLPKSTNATAAAVKIQAAYRSHLVRSLVRQIRAVSSEADRFEDLIRRQETVDAVRGDDRERLRMSEGLMSALLRLDSVRGIYPSVRELRRSVSHRIVALQEVLDAVCDARVGTYSVGFPPSWEEILAQSGGDCGVEERGGERECCCDWERGVECLDRVLWRLRV